MNEKASILVVDDEVEVLNALTRLFRRKYQVHATTEPEQAIELLKTQTFVAIISDMRMPKMTGVQFLEQAFLIAPDTPRLLLTGYSDMQSTANAINVGRVSNYVSKPWDNDELVELVNQAAEQFQIQMAAKCYQQQVEGKNKKLTAHSQALNSKLNKDKALLEQLSKKLELRSNNTRSLFHDVVELMCKISQKAVGDEDGHVKRVALHSRLLAKHLCLEPAVVSRCYLAGLMHEIGKVSLPDELMFTPEADLTPVQKEQRQQHVMVAAELLSTIPALEPIADIVKHQYERVDGTGFPDHLIGSNISSEARILAIVNDYDKLLLGRVSGKVHSPEQAQQHMKEDVGAYDKEMLPIYFKMLSQYKFEAHSELDICIGTNQLEPGMTLSRDIHGTGQSILLTKSTELTGKHIEKLKKYEKEWNTILNVFVH